MVLMVNEHPRCSVKVPGVGGWHHTNCQRRGKIQRDGAWYCTQHDPIAVEQRRAKRRRQVDREVRVMFQKGLVREALGDVVKVARHVVANPPTATLEDLEAAVRELDDADRKLLGLQVGVK